MWGVFASSFGWLWGTLVRGASLKQRNCGHVIGGGWGAGGHVDDSGGHVRAGPVIRSLATLHLDSQEYSRETRKTRWKRTRAQARTCGHVTRPPHVRPASLLRPSALLACFSVSMLPALSRPKSRAGENRDSESLQSRGSVGAV